MLEFWLAGEPVPPMGPRAQLIFEQVKAAFVDREGCLPEPAYAIDVQTGAARLIGTRLDRQYGELGPNEIALTTDWVRATAQAVEVGDLKTGFAGHVAHPRENLQLLAAAYAAAKVAGVKVAIPRILIAREDETVPLFARLDGEEWMEAVLSEIREIHFRTQLPSPAVAGEHCSFCPALGACPQTAHLQALEVNTEAMVRWTTECLSAENDAKMVMHLPMLKKAVDAIEDALKTRGPIALPNGKVWRETRKTMRVLDKEKVERELGARLPEFYKEIETSNGYRQVKG
jgi:CRISPR/Cas system-associated exonuclease Cas4 (RecB family)